MDSLFPLLGKLEVDLLNCLERVLRVVKFLPSKSGSPSAARACPPILREGIASKHETRSKKKEKDKEKIVANIQ